MPERYCVIYKTANVSDFEFLGTSSVNFEEGASRALFPTPLLR